MKRLRSGQAAAIVTAALILTVYYFLIFPDASDHASVIRSLIYIPIFLVWGLSVHRRVIHTQIRKLFTAVSLLMLFWIIARGIRFSLEEANLLKHYLWYLYYLPMTFIPLLTTLIATFMGRSESYRLPRWTLWLFAAAAAVFLLVLTNDLHRLVFVFPEGVDPVTETDYTYGVGYVAVAFWAFSGIAATLAVLFSRSRLPGRGRRFVTPIISAVIMLIYFVLYFLRFPPVFPFFRDMTIVYCLLTVCILESCLRTGLIQSNTNYGELFGISSTRAVIVDKHYDEVAASRSYKHLPKELLLKAETAPVMLEDELRLSSAPIKNGRVLWQEDVSEITAILGELTEVNGRLAEDNDLLIAEDEMKQRRARVAEQDRLYDKMSREVLPQLHILDEILSEDTEMSPSEKLKRICVYGTFVKRRCNLMLLAEDAGSCPAAELEYCIRESCEALSAAGTDCSFRRDFGGELPIQTAIILYDILEELIELTLSSLTAFFLNMTVRGEDVKIKLLADHSEEMTASPRKPALLSDLGGSFDMTREDGTTSVTVTLRKGAGA